MVPTSKPGKRFTDGHSFRLSGRRFLSQSSQSADFNIAAIRRFATSWAGSIASTPCRKTTYAGTECLTFCSPARDNGTWTPPESSWHASRPGAGGLPSELLSFRNSTPQFVTARLFDHAPALDTTKQVSTPCHVRKRPHRCASVASNVAACSMLQSPTSSSRRSTPIPRPPFTIGTGDPDHGHVRRTGTGTLTYDWQLTQGASVIAEGHNPSFQFTPLDDANYSVTSPTTATKPSPRTPRTLSFTTFAPCSSSPAIKR